MGGLELSVPFTKSITQELEKRLRSYDHNDAKFVDSVKAFGEESNAKIVAEYLKKKGVNVQYVDPKDVGFVVEEEFGNSQLLDSSYPSIREGLEDREGIVIFPGFYGYTQRGDIVTFSRGGSDLTGAILAAALDATEYENFTDVLGIRRADPRIVEDPERIGFLTYAELRELSYMGFNVFHDEAMFPVINAHIPTHVRKTSEPNKQGTYILEHRVPESDEIITGIACKKGFCTIDLKKYMMNREKGFIRRLAQIMEESDISIEHMPSGVDSISVIFEKAQLDNSLLDKITRRIYNELKVDEIRVEHDEAMIVPVGQGMIHKAGVAQRITGACANAGISIVMLNQGASELSMVVGVKEKEAPYAVRAIYKEFFGS